MHLAGLVFWRGDYKYLKTLIGPGTHLCSPYSLKALDSPASASWVWIIVVYYHARFLQKLLTSGLVFLSFILTFHPWFSLPDMPTNKVEQIPYGERITLRPDPLPERSTFDAGGIPRENNNFKLNFKPNYYKISILSKIRLSFNITKRFLSLRRWFILLVNLTLYFLLLVLKTLTVIILYCFYRACRPAW